MQLYEDAWKAIIQPMQFKSKSQNYGPRQQIIDNQLIVRKDITIHNRNNKKIKGFIFTNPKVRAKQTILYLHGNGGTKLQALPLVTQIAKYNINLAAFDFLGCGHSDREYLTYGVNEVYDIRDMVMQILNMGYNEKIILWGRSMGAQCCIMYAEMYPCEIGGIILDSPFRSLSKVIQRIALNKVSVPQILLKPALFFIKRKASSEANQEIFSIDYLQIFNKITPNIPILFIYSHFDKIVLTEEVLTFYNSYQGPKGLCEIFQTHDDDRPDKLFNECLAWMTRTQKSATNKKLNTVYKWDLHDQKSTSFCC